MKITTFLIILLFPFTGSAQGEFRLISNVKNFREIESGVLEKPLEGNVYDLSFVAYDKDFADEFGLVEKNITEMDKHLRFMEIRMITEGSKTNCYYNVVLDKKVELDFPEENYIKNKMHPRLNLPVNPQAPKSNRDKRRLLITHNIWPSTQPYMNRSALGNRGYKFHKKGKPFSDGAATTILIIYYIQDRSDKYNILSFKGGCGLGVMLDYPDLALWVRMKGHPQNEKGLNLDDYHTFIIPQTILDGFKPVSIIHSADYKSRKRSIK